MLFPGGAAPRPPASPWAGPPGPHAPWGLRPPNLASGGGCALRTLRSGGRGGRGLHLLIFFLLVFQICFRGSTGLGRYPVCSGVNFHVECIKNYVWEPLGALDMTDFVKRVFVAKDALRKNHGQKEH